MAKQFCDHIVGRGSILVLCGFIIVILICVMACTGGKTPAVNAALSDLEIIRRDSVLWSQAGITDCFSPSAERKHTDTLHDVTNLQKQLDSLSDRGGGRLVVPAGRFEITRTVIIPVWHSWRPFSFGVPGQHQPPGPYNVIFRNRTDYKNKGPQVDKDAFYFLADFFLDSEKVETRFIATPYAENFPYGVYNQTYQE